MEIGATPCHCSLHLENAYVIPKLQKMHKMQVTGIQGAILIKWQALIRTAFKNPVLI